mgnify:CR=1 FL=1
MQNRVATSTGGPCAGGTVYAAQPATIAHTTFSANQVLTVLAAAQGGALWARTNAWLQNLLLHLNVVNGAPGYGAALYVNHGALDLNASTIANNFGEGVYRAASTSLALRNSIFWNNTDDLAGLPTNALGQLPDVSYCLIQDGDNEGFQGCFSADPQFERGFYLAGGSPALDAGGDMAADLLLSDRTTRTNGAPDEGRLDLGFHFASGLDPAVADLYVSGAGSDNQSGSDWDNAFRSITRALSVARDGTCIHIGAGLYTTNGETFPLTPSQQGLTLKGTGPEEVIINATGANTRVFVIQALDQLRIQGVTIQGGVNVQSNPFLGGGLYAAYSKFDLLDCRMANNTVTNLGEGFTFKGGGFYALGCDLSLSNCVVVSNTAGFSSSTAVGARSGFHAGGGGMIEGGKPAVIVDSLFMHNWCRGRGYSGIGDTLCGGGLYVSVPLTLVRTHFISNALSGSLAWMYGGGVYAASTLVADECRWIGNRLVGENSVQSGGGTPSSQGGAVYAGGEMRLRRAVVSRNSATATPLRISSALGGGLCGSSIILENALLNANGLFASNQTAGGAIYGTGTFAFTNITVAQNATSGVHYAGSGPVSIRNAIFWENAGQDLVGIPTNEAGVMTSVWYCAISDGQNDGVNGCLNVDPCFADTNTFHLKSRMGTLTDGYFRGITWEKFSVHSPLIDAGDPATPYSEEPVPNGRRVNLGAYGHTPAASKSLAKGTLLIRR